MNKLLPFILIVTALILSGCPSTTYKTCSASINLIIHNNTGYNLNCTIEYSYNDYSGTQSTVTETETYNNLGPLQSGTVMMNLSWEESDSWFSASDESVTVTVKGVRPIVNTVYHTSAIVKNHQTGDVNVELE